MSHRSEVFTIGNDEYGFKVFINHTHNQIDVEVIDSEVEEGENPTASITPDELKNLANELINLDFNQDKSGSFVK
jgi:hypothetical protein